MRVWSGGVKTAGVRTITVGEYQLTCHERGEGDPVLCIHSGGFSSRQWKRLADLLAPSHRVLLPDLIGYGASSPLREPAPWTYLDDLASLVALVEGEPPMHVVAHSYGGLLALLLAIARPSAVRSLALYEPVAFGILDEPSDAAARAGLTLDGSHYTGEPWLQAFVEWWQGAGAWAQMAGDARAAFIAVGWKVFREVSTLVLDTTDRAGYRTITVPTLLMNGAASPLSERRVVEKLAAALPRADRSELPRLGHMGPITHAALINPKIAEHIARC